MTSLPILEAEYEEECREAMAAVFTPTPMDIDPPKLTIDRIEDGSLVALFKSSPEGRERALRMAETWSNLP